MSSPSTLAVWPEPDAFAANSVGRLTAGQHRMLLGEPTPPPYASLAVIALAVVGGAVVWWRFGFGPGITVILVGSNIGLAVMSMNLDRRRRRRRLRSDLDRPAFGGGLGEVVAVGNGVDIRSGVGLIELGLGAPAAPPPGWYDMYWLEHPGAQRWNADRVLLSARPRSRPAEPGAWPDPFGRPTPVADPAGAGGADPSADPVIVAEVAARLREVLARTESELEYNRAAQLSPPQLVELHRQARRGVWARSTGVVVGTLVALLFLASAILAWRRPPAEDPDALAGGIIGASLGLLLVWFTVRAALRLPDATAAVANPPPLARAIGPVTTKLVDWENGTWTVAVERGPTFSVRADVARAFGTPMPYVIYYVLRGRETTLMAAEPLRHGDHGAAGYR